jgi:TrmH family RNA methyltransferase
VALITDARSRGIEVTELDEKEFRTAAETESPQGIVALAAVPAWSLVAIRDASPMRLLVLDAVQDPGNVGTIIRTAAALGATATVALPGTVDVWNAKVVRSAMGAHFHHPAFHATWEDVHAFLDGESIPLWAADAGGEPVPGHAPRRLALAVGNEGAGLSEAVRAVAGKVVSLPITKTVESLNVAVATGILLHELRP